MLRVAALMAMLLGAVGVTGYLTVAGTGPFASAEERHLRAMKRRLTAPARTEPITFAGIGALPHGRPLAEYSAIERRGVYLEGYVQAMLNSSDGDIHLQIGATEAVPTWPNIPFVTAEIDPRWRQNSRTWQFHPLQAALRPVGSGYSRWDRPARRARIHGWLLYDYEYDTPVTATIGRITGWEIHPVTAIELWDEEAQRFAALPR
jgi:hypothetical protein